MKRLGRRIQSRTATLLTRVRDGIGSLAFLSGLTLVAASAFTVGLTLGLLVSGVLLTAGAVFWERGSSS